MDAAVFDAIMSASRPDRDFEDGIFSHGAAYRAGLVQEARGEAR